MIANEEPPQKISLNSHSIYSIPLSQYRKDCVNLFPQDSYLFSGTIRDVVDPHHHFSPQLILNQLQRFSQVILSENKSPTIDSLTSTSTIVTTSHILNLNYDITANGANISAGEKQILTLVRASLCEAKVVILDEITSNMSIPAAEISLKMLRSDLVEKKQAGIILICHRPEDMALCDQVCFSLSSRFSFPRSSGRS